MVGWITETSITTLQRDPWAAAGAARAGAADPKQRWLPWLAFRDNARA